LTIWVEEVDIVASDKVLGKTDDGRRQTNFTVVVCRLFRDITSQLSHFDLLDNTLFETTKEDLSLTGFQTIRT
jgi:hypothetical protein